ncbi:hypothetical protein GWK08_12420 [Leptobacterium flavescens]|uniref:SMP-30/Gluconolactonase/LRE-like region domain-containing protein n=1 Tax=Leptobacterium flavescens TaxID=472055 RepID=A0A6P0UR63_9FLAO|nr:hypothetical protein [Leptobacterium flavescens]NER14249.1 hypothetical protein [Leptobacterium flavescens]
MRTRLLLLCFSLIFISNTNAQSLRELFTQSKQAYEHKNYEEFRNLNLQALKIHPSQPAFLYNLAVAHALNKEPQAAAKALKYILSWNATLKFGEDKDLEGLKASHGLFNKIQAHAEGYRKTVKNSRLLFELPANFHVEDVVRIGEQVYFTDIHSGAVGVYNLKEGNFKEILKLDRSAIAIEKGAEDHIIWISASMMDQYSDFDTEKALQSTLLKFDTRQQKVITKINIPGKSVIGSMIMDAGGTLYATNSVKPEVLLIDAKEGAVKKTIEIEGAFNLQGIALDKNRQQLYIADYIKGIAKLDLKSGSVEWLRSEEYLLKGIDGLYLIKEGSLIAIQNNSNPRRVVQIAFKGNQVQKVTLLDNALPLDGEPTNGYYDPSYGFIYVANSQWPFYSKENKPLKEKWEKQQIRVMEEL